VELVSSKFDPAGPMAAIMIVLELPPNDSESKYVS